jgi:hypothetical protein
MNRLAPALATKYPKVPVQSRLEGTEGVLICVLRPYLPTANADFRSGAKNKAPRNSTLASPGMRINVFSAVCRRGVQLQVPWHFEDKCDPVLKLGRVTTENLGRFPTRDPDFPRGFMKVVVDRKVFLHIGKYEVGVFLVALAL